VPWYSLLQFTTLMVIKYLLTSHYKDGDYKYVLLQVGYLGLPKAHKTKRLHPHRILFWSPDLSRFTQATACHN